MPDRFSAFINIGGRLRKRHVARFIKLVADCEASLDWGDAIFRPRSEKELCEALTGDLLALCNDQAPYGEFDKLETGCRKLGLSYMRCTEGKYEYDGVRVDWRPGMRQPLVRDCSNERSSKVFVAADAVAKALAALERGHVERAIKILRRLCPEIAPLPPFEIVA